MKSCILRYDGRPFLLRERQGHLEVVAPENDPGGPFKEQIIGPLEREKPRDAVAFPFPGGYWQFHKSSEWVAKATHCHWLKSATCYPNPRLRGMHVLPIRWAWPSRSEPTLDVVVLPDMPLIYRTLDDRIAKGELPVLERPTLRERAHDAWLALLDDMSELGVERAYEERGQLYGRAALPLASLELQEGACPFILPSES